MPITDSQSIDIMIDGIKVLFEDMEEKLDALKTRISKLEQIVHRNRPHRFESGICKDCLTPEQEGKR